MARSRDLNKRYDAWMRRHPWRHGAIMATMLIGWLALLRLQGPGLSWTLIAVFWVLAFVFNGVLGRYLARLRSDDTTSWGTQEPIEADNRRRRQGLP